MKGMAIIRGVCAHYGISSRRFFSKERAVQVKSARLMAMQQMLSAGLSKAAIARLLHCDPSTVCYWLRRDEIKARRAPYFLRYHAMRREARGIQPMRKVTDQQRAELLRLHGLGMIDERNALQQQLGLKRGYTTALIFQRKKAEHRRNPKLPIGPSHPQGHPGIRWTQPEARA
jgi:DNA-binding CsgD family transcriptional regulator